MLGSWGPSARAMLGQLSKQLIDTFHDQKAGHFRAQRISIAFRRGYAASLLGTLPISDEVEEFFDACT